MKDSRSFGWAGRQYTRRQALRTGVGATLGGMALTSTGLLSVLLQACGPSQGSSGGSLTPKKGGILRVGSNSFDANVPPDPIRSATIANAMLDWLVYEGLTIAHNETYTFSPGLAASWEVNSDATQWTFHLRSGVTFHDGTPFTSKDAQWSLQRLLDPSVGALMFSRVNPSFDASGVQVVDDHTLVVKLKRPDADLAYTLGQPQVGIVKNGSPLITSASLAIGTGPFKVVSFAPGQSWEIQRNDNYWVPGVTYLDRIRCELIADTSTLLTSIQSGSLDLTTALDESSASALDRNTGVQDLVKKNMIYFNFVMDPTQAPFTDPRVIKAFKLACDRNKILQTVFQGKGTTTYDVPIPPDSPFYPKSLGTGPQDIAQARSLLSAAGHPNGISIDLITAPQTAGMVDIAVAYAATVKDAGINVNVKTLSNADYGAEVGSNTLFYIDNWFVVDPLQTLTTSYYTNGQGNESKLSDTQVDAMVNQALGTVDATARGQILTAALERATQNASQVVPVLIDDHFGAAKNLHGVNTIAWIELDLRRAWLG